VLFRTKRFPLWPQFATFKLTKNIRAHEDQQEFANWLIKLGNGQLGNDLQQSPPGSISIPTQCHIVTDSLIDSVFPDLSDPSTLANTVILSPTNDNTLHLNDAILKNLPGQETVYLSTDKAICDDEAEAQNYPMEFLHSLTPSGMPPHRLLLKPGAIIMLLRNLDIRKGLCNGTRLTLHHLHEHVLDAEILTGTNQGERVLIPRIRLAPSDVSLPFTLQRTQFPIRLSYSMTINKSQGQTFDKLGIYLPTPVFAHGQLYVAFSRARSFTDIYIKIDQTTTQGFFSGNWNTQNVVYPEIL
jgi:hypothetical protein